jgi:DNA repair photolyase
MLLPGVPAPNLAPRMGKDPLHERGGVRYLPLESRSLLNRCNGKRVPFDWTVNPYRGCAMGCRYCYAAYTHEFLGIARPEEFHSTVYVKRGAEPETATALALAVRRQELVALGTATDPYQPGESREQVTRRFLELVAQHRGVRLAITTKGAVILRDLDLLLKIQARSSLSIHVSLISPRSELLRRIEPWAPPPEVRIDVMRRLAAAGLRVSLSLAPILPAITDAEPDLDELIGRVAAAGVPRMTCSLLFLRSPTKEKYLRFVATEFPGLLPAYQRAYAAHAYLAGRYKERMLAAVERLRLKHGLGNGFDEAFSWRKPRPPAQLGLFAYQTSS